MTAEHPFTEEPESFLQGLRKARQAIKDAKERAEHPEDEIEDV